MNSSLVTRSAIDSVETVPSLVLVGSPTVGNSGRVQQGQIKGNEWQAHRTATVLNALQDLCILTGQVGGRVLGVVQTHGARCVSFQSPSLEDSACKLLSSGGVEALPMGHDARPILSNPATFFGPRADRGVRPETFCGSVRAERILVLGLFQEWNTQSTIAYGVRRPSSPVA